MANAFKVLNLRGTISSKILSIFLQSLLAFINYHTAKSKQVTGRKIQLTALTPKLIHVLTITDPDSKVTSPSEGKIFKIMEPISPTPPMVESAFFPTLLISIYSSFFISFIFSS